MTSVAVGQRVVGEPYHKYDYIKQKRHFQPVQSQAEVCAPVGQYPLRDHSREKAHFPLQWNMPTTSTTEVRPREKKPPVLSPSPRISRVRMIQQPDRPQGGHFPQKQRQHFAHSGATTISYADVNLGRKLRTQAPGQPGAEFALEKLMTRKHDVPPSQRGNGITFPVEKTFQKGEYDFCQFGATVSHSMFGKMAGGHGDNRRSSARGQKMEQGLSTRADDFWRTQLPNRTDSRVKSNKPYHQIVQEQALAAEINMVLELPDSLMGEEGDSQEPAADTSAKGAKGGRPSSKK